MENNSLSSTIERTLMILELFLNQPNGFTAQEMIEKTGISRSTLVFDAKSFERSGLPGTNPESGSLFRGTKIQRLDRGNNTHHSGIDPILSTGKFFAGVSGNDRFGSQ